MEVHRLISAPGGDVPATPELLKQPYRISFSDHHPYLTLGDYFAAAEDFFSGAHRESVAALLGRHAGRAIPAEAITGIWIRSEKHGALYHLGSVEVFAGPRSVKLALSAAVSEEGKRWLAREWDTLRSLEQAFHLPYLPQPYFRGEAHRQGGDTFAMLAAQWFEGFREWHLSVDKRSHVQRLVIWDGSLGNRWAEVDEIVEIYRKSAAILTRYYDTRSFMQIYPWRHAAGDFVVRTGAGGPDVRLTTARSYVRVIDRISGEAVHPIIALVYFFLDLVTRMQLDRLDGTGAVAWAGPAAAEAAVQGFFDALLDKEARGNHHLGLVADLTALLKGFDRNELEKLFDPLWRLYESGDPEEMEVIRRNLSGHTRELHRIIQTLPPAGPAKGS